ncbi:MAG: hypothetical protein ACOYBP_09010 [Microbacteriaceae bacterium]
MRTPEQRQQLYAAIIRHKASFKRATHHEIAEALQCNVEAVHSAISDRHRQVRVYAEAHPQLDENQIARAMRIPVRVVTRSLSLARKEPRKPVEACTGGPALPSVPPLCRHDRARNAREHKSSELFPCCLRQHPGQYIAVVLPRGNGLWIAMSPQLSVTVKSAPSLDDAEAQLRAAADRMVDRALDANTFLPMPQPLEAPMPRELWGISIPSDKARGLYLRWRDEVTAPPVQWEAADHAAGTDS